jgi:hypothetical protein
MFFPASADQLVAYNTIDKAAEVVEVQDQVVDSTPLHFAKPRFLFFQIPDGLICFGRLASRLTAADILFDDSTAYPM